MIFYMKRFGKRGLGQVSNIRVLDPDVQSGPVTNEEKNLSNIQTSRLFEINNIQLPSGPHII
jgi:hypothetical protein